MQKIFTQSAVKEGVFRVGCRCTLIFDVMSGGTSKRQMAQGSQARGKYPASQCSYMSSSHGYKSMTR